MVPAVAPPVAFDGPASLTHLPSPQFLIIEVSAISSTEVESLHAIRDAGWPGMIIAIGEASEAMQRSLGIDLVLDRNLGSEVLRTALKQLGSERPTMLRNAR